MSVNNLNNDDLSFLEKKDANALSGKDIVITIVRNLHWILLCGVIGAAIAWFRSDRADRIYESHAKILINSITRNRLDNGMSMLENITNRRIATTMNAINDEIIVLGAEAPMIEVAKRLNLGMDYRYKTKLVKRVKTLYKESPIDVLLPDVKETAYASLAVTVSRDSTVMVQIGDAEPVRGRLRDTLRTKLGRVIVQPTWALRELFYDNPISVIHRNIYDVAENYRHRVNIERNSTTDAIVNFSLHDTSPQRAADILNEMIAVYNEGIIEEKTRIIQTTSDYINTRIAQLNSELGAKESQIASFKRDNQLLHLDEYGQSYISSSIESTEELERIQNEISTTLSPLEQQVLAAFLNGKSYQEIAEMLDRHVKSIDNALQRVKRKLTKMLEDID